MTLKATPRPVLLYGLLGLIPFLAPPVFALAQPGSAHLALVVQAHYAALILSFLGGARWGLAVSRSAPDPITFSVSMLPTLIALALVTLLDDARGPQLISLAVALTAQWAWDLRLPDAPLWFSPLRTVLTLGAVAGLLGGVLALG
jgi:hypothetical protein